MIKISNIYRLLLISVVVSLSCFFTLAKAVQDESFGRLFSRPNERNNLDDLRQNQKLKINVPQTETDKSANVAPVVSSQPITLQGYVKRSDGVKSTLWINNQAVQEGSVVDNVQVGKLNQPNKKRTLAQEGLDLKVPSNGKHIHLKAGQMYEPETNQIKELRIVEKERQLYLEETGVIGDEKLQD